MGVLFRRTRASRQPGRGPCVATIAPLSDPHASGERHPAAFVRGTGVFGLGGGVPHLTMNAQKLQARPAIAAPGDHKPIYACAVQTQSRLGGGNWPAVRSGIRPNISWNRTPRARILAPAQDRHCAAPRSRPIFVQSRVGPGRIVTAPPPLRTSGLFLRSPPSLGLPQSSVTKQCRRNRAGCPGDARAPMRPARGRRERGGGR